LQLRGKKVNQESEKPPKIRAAERQRQTLEVRKRGVSFEVIAEQLGYAGSSGAFKAVNLALKRTMQEAAKATRELHLRRIERLMATRFQGALDAIMRPWIGF
jgi:hypothetical protein